MSTDPNGYNKQTDLTQPVYYNPPVVYPNYETTEQSPPSRNPYLSSPYMDVPPPPPNRKPLAVAFVGILCLTAVITAILTGSFFTVMYSRTQVAPATRYTDAHVASPTQTPKQNYDAHDIMRDFNAAGIHPKFVEYNTTIWSWSADTYSVSVDATSSVNFTDDSRCSGYCDPQNIGVWVYSSKDAAVKAYDEVHLDENQDGPPPGLGLPNEVVHGRCLLLGPSVQSIYGQVVMYYCT